MGASGFEYDDRIDRPLGHRNDLEGYDQEDEPTENLTNADKDARMFGCAPSTALKLTRSGSLAGPLLIAHAQRSEAEPYHDFTQ